MPSNADGYDMERLTLGSSRCMSTPDYVSGFRSAQRAAQAAAERDE